MGKRREGREAAVQFLVYCDLNKGAGVASAEEFWSLRPASKSIRDFALNLVDGVLKYRTETDERIARYAENYEIRRLAAVDRNILRLAIYEMLHRNDIPPVVSINEAIEIAKRFGAEESSRFVNGILDRVKLDLTRPLRTANESKNSKENKGQDENLPAAKAESVGVERTFTDRAVEDGPAAAEKPWRPSGESERDDPED